MQKINRHSKLLQLIFLEDYISSKPQFLAFPAFQPIQFPAILHDRTDGPSLPMMWALHRPSFLMLCALCSLSLLLLPHPCAMSSDHQKAPPLWAILFMVAHPLPEPATSDTEYFVSKSTYEECFFVSKSIIIESVCCVQAGNKMSRCFSEALDKTMWRQPTKA